MTKIIGCRNQGWACTYVDVVQGLTFVGSYRYDGLYVVDKVSVILV